MKRILTTITMSLAIYSMQAQTESYTADKGNGYAKLRIQSDGDGTNNNSLITMTAYGYGGTSDLIVRNGNWGGGYYFKRGASGGTFNQVRIIHGGGGSNGYQTGYGILDIYGSGDVVGTRISGGGNSYFLNGNFGIGMSDPGSNLSVNKDISFGKFKTSLPAHFTVYDNSTNPQIPTLISGSAGGTLLESNGYGQFVVGLRDNGGDDGFHVISTSQSYSGQQNGSAAPYNKLVASFLANGKVGIGTNNPDGHLNVVGTSSATQVKIHLANKALNGYSVIRFSDVDGGSGKAYIHRFNSSWVSGTAMWEANSIGFYESIGSMNIGGKSSFKVFTGDNNSERLRIDDAGNVGIGTSTTGSHKLAVEGSIGAREIKVEASGWSDFVFEKGYELRTLEEVEKHIVKRGHLPEIPSEAEVSENGINLGEMDAKLLQKIEELTLYMIDMNKRMGQLETENTELKEKVQLLENQ